MHTGTHSSISAQSPYSSLGCLQGWGSTTSLGNLCSASPLLCQCMLSFHSYSYCFHSHLHSECHLRKLKRRMCQFCPFSFRSLPTCFNSCQHTCETFALLHSLLSHGKLGCTTCAAVALRMVMFLKNEGIHPTVFLSDRANTLYELVTLITFDGIWALSASLVPYYSRVGRSHATSIIALPCKDSLCECRCLHMKEVSLHLQQHITGTVLL